jgi:hypothetical protein
MSEEELKKICKELFYWIWNADKQVSQGTLIETLPSLELFWIPVLAYDSELNE